MTIDVIFLDFDGVLHPVFPRNDRPYIENQHFSYAEALGDAIEQHCPNAILVVSSEWRKQKTMAELKELLPESLAKRLVGGTPAAPYRYPGQREDEALSWIKTFQETKKAPVRWCAVDDVPDIWRSHNKVLICNDGFQTAEREAFGEYIEDLFNADLIPAAGIVVI